MPRHSLQQLSKIALQVATEAAQLTMKGFRTTHDVRLKPGNEPVTSYDLKSEELVRQRLSELTPDIPVIGEEAGGEAAGSERVWYCDPIDGTVNYLRGQPFFCVSLGLAEGNRSVAGAVVAPALRQWWRGSEGERAFRNESPCQVSGTPSMREAVLSTGLPQRGAADGEPLRVLGRLIPEVRDIRRCGSAAIELCMVADGTYDLYVSPKLALWDTCAGIAIARAAGAEYRELQLAGKQIECVGTPNLLRDLPALLTGES